MTIISTINRLILREQPEDDEGMSDDDLKESQKMLFDFLGVTE